jgi:hypothetical protein
MWEPKASQRERKGTVRISKWSQNKTNTTQMKSKGNQKGANRRINCSKIMPWSVLSFRLFTVSFYQHRQDPYRYAGLGIVKA